MVTEADVEQAYRLFLGREPENRAVVVECAKANRNLADLRRTFLNSREFRELLGQPASTAASETPGFKPLIWPESPVETDVSEDLVDRMVERVEQQFQYLGKTEPYWSVISSERYLSRNMAGRENDFFESGKGVVDDLIAALRRYDIDPAAVTKCFELGCGVGRSTVWLAERFPEVIAADISKPHLQIAAEALRAKGNSNASLLQIGSVSRLQEIRDYDLFFSIIVLQHNPPPIIKRILGIILNNLRPGGLAYFQVPTYSLNYRFIPSTYLASPLDPTQPEMHVLPQPALFDLLIQNGCRLIEIREDGASGPTFISNRVLAMKRRA
jgi:SAM-dependent methyltransferase